MTLPISLVTPTFDVVVPSTKKKIKCRPFLVKENKILLAASESKDPEEILNATKQMFANCILDWNGHKLENLAIFDFEYILLKIRCRSKGEVATLAFGGLVDSECAECRKDKVIKIELDKIEIKYNENNSKKVELTEEVGMIMKYPKYTLAFDMIKAGQKSQSSEVFFDLIYDCIESLYDKDNVYEIKDMEKSEIIEFVDSFTSEQMEKVQKFFDTLPTIEHEVDLGCKTCGREEKQTIRGLASFFE